MLGATPRPITLSDSQIFLLNDPNEPRVHWMVKLTVGVVIGVAISFGLMLHPVSETWPEQAASALIQAGLVEPPPPREMPILNSLPVVDQPSTQSVEVTGVPTAQPAPFVAAAAPVYAAPQGVATVVEEPERRVKKKRRNKRNKRNKRRRRR